MTAMLLLAFVLSAALALPSGAAADDALSVLASTTETPPFHGEQIIATWNRDGAQTTLVKVEHDPPDWTRLEYQPVGSGQRRIVVRHAGSEVEYDPRSRTGTRRALLPDLDDDLLSAHLSWLRQNYRVTTQPAAILNRPAQRIDLVPVARNRPERRMFVDEATGVVLRSERFAPDGRLTELTAFLSFVPEPQGWRGDAEVPDGLHISAQPAPRPVSETDVRWLLGKALPPFVPPQGFHHVATYLTADRPAAAQRVYSDGLSTLVLTQQPGSTPRPPAGSRVVRVDGRPVWIHSMGLRTLAHWVSSGWMYTLVGDVTPRGMVASARRTGVAHPPTILQRLIAWVMGVRQRIHPQL